MIINKYVSYSLIETIYYSLDCGGRFRNTYPFYQHLDDTELVLTIADLVADVSWSC